MKIIKNISNNDLIIFWFPLFLAWEEREVTVEQSIILLKNSNFIEKKQIKTKNKK